MLLAIYAFLGNLGGPEIILIILFVLIFFGAKKIPEIARGLGKGIREFKNASNEIKQEVEEGVRNDTKFRKAPSPEVNEEKPIEDLKPVIKNDTSRNTPDMPL